MPTSLHSDSPLESGVSDVNPPNNAMPKSNPTFHDLAFTVDRSTVSNTTFSEI